MCLLCISGLAGLPQLSLPMASIDDLPLGLSIIGRRGSDAMLLSIAKRIEGGSRITPAGVIPAPVASVARERDQAGSQTRHNLLLGAGLAPERPAANRVFAELCMGPGLSASALSGTRGAGMTSKARPMQHGGRAVKVRPRLKP